MQKFILGKVFRLSLSSIDYPGLIDKEFFFRDMGNCLLKASGFKKAYKGVWEATHNEREYYWTQDHDEYGLIKLEVTTVTVL